MRIMRFLVCSVALLSGSVMAQFHDQGFVNAVVRTDYNSQTEGQSSNPVTFIAPCLFPGQICGTGPTVYATTNKFTQNGQSWPQSGYWVLSINNENAYDKICPANPDPDAGCAAPGQLLATTQNSGPPNQSLPRASPGFGLMGFTAFMDTPAGENFFRAHMVMNGTFPNPEFGGLPFLSLGAEQFRGNGSPPGYLNWLGRPRKVAFKARLWDFKLPSPVSPGQPATLVFYVYFRTSWGSKSRGLFITLAHWNFDNSDAADPARQFTPFRWNWPMQESFFHPGVDWVFIDAEDIQPLCGFSVPRLTSIGQEISYNLDLQALFQCASNLGGFEVPMPGGIRPIEGVHWAVEMSGENGWIWPSVHDMKMLP